MGLGAFNDNLFKSAIAIFITYNLAPETANQLVQLSAGLFILPFFLISGISGQICDRYEKSKLMRFIKLFEILIMLLGAYGFIKKNVTFLLCTLFLMGAQSTLFGPVKYSILPQHLTGKLLLKGNAYTSMGTFIFILCGTILGGSLVSTEVVNNFGYIAISLAVIFFAFLGLLSSLYIPEAAPANPNQRISLNIFKQTYTTIKLSFHNKKIFESIFGISWFWFFGFFFMASLPLYCRDIIRGDEFIATVYLAVISVGMGLGSILGNKLTKGNLKMGLVGISGIGLSLFAILFSLTPERGTTEIENISKLFNQISYLYSNISLLGIGIFGGLLIVPLYTQLQIESPDNDRSKFIACNNILNALFMVIAAIFSMVLLGFGVKINHIFLIVSLINLSVFIFYIYSNPRQFYLCFFDILFRLLYSIKIDGADKIQKSGPVIIASNHVSFLDPLLLCTILNRPPIFVMDQMYFDFKLLRWFYKSAGAIPITPKKISSDGMEKAMNQITCELNAGELIAIFPEGFITKNGEMIPFKDGIKRLAERITDLNLYPVAISGMWGSWFSRFKDGKAMSGVPMRRSFRTNIRLSIGDKIEGPEIAPEVIRNKVEELRGDIL